MLDCALVHKQIINDIKKKIIIVRIIILKYKVFNMKKKKMLRTRKRKIFIN